MRRPTGVILIALLTIYLASQQLLLSLTLFDIGGHALLQVDKVTASGWGFFLAGVTLAFFSAVLMTFAIGLWNLKPWAWSFGILVQFFGLFVTLLLSILGVFNNFTIPIGTLLLHGFILWYLFLPKVQQLFR